MLLAFVMNICHGAEWHLAEGHLGSARREKAAPGPDTSLRLTKFLEVHMGLGESSRRPGRRWQIELCKEV